MRFNKLRLSGFKSFVDPTDVAIEQGLTGIVGPNGCGKSNLVEALRWVMGETSAKQVRGGEMDDIIFGGTADRPARNIAEVLLNLDNSARIAPAQFNDMDELDISRRIERDKGSIYRVNGKEVRARDVQLLFADAATGARSTALVSQGRISDVINSKPTARRQLLEEAAGITGLHSRRHEAELRLRGAETNLQRLDDILGTLDVQLHHLRKQCRQANRYRSLSGRIRRTEATLYHLRWRTAVLDSETSSELLKETEAQVAELTGRAAAAATRQAECAAGLPEPRQAEAEAAAKLHRLNLASESLDAEERRIEDQAINCRTRLQQVAADLDREKALAVDAEAAMERLQSEQREMETAAGSEEQTRRHASENLDAANEAARELESELTELTERAADDEARRAGLKRAIAELEERQHRLAERAAEVAEQRAVFDSGSLDDGDFHAAGETRAECGGALADARKDVEAAEIKRSRADGKAASAALESQTAEAAAARLEAESQALTEVLKAGETETRPPLIDAITVEPGFETALGAALGEDLTAPADEQAPVHWRTLAPFSAAPSLPKGVEPLSSHVKGPKVLTRRLSQIGVVANEEAAMLVSEKLSQGQRLVSRDGGLWRWDGFTVSAGAATAAAARLEQRNRLGEIRSQLIEAQSAAAAAGEKAQATRTAADEAIAAERTAREAVRAADESYLRARDVLTEMKERAADKASRLAALGEAAASMNADIGETRARAAAAARELTDFPDPEILRGRVTKMRSEAAERRALQVECQSAFDSLDRGAEERRRRLQAIAGEMGSWRRRAAGAGRQIEQLQDRRQAAMAELDRLSQAPTEIAGKRQALLERIEEAERRRNAAAVSLAEAENSTAEAERSRRQAEGELAQAREQRVRAEGAVEQSRQARGSLSERIAERLHCRGDDLREIAELKEDAEWPDLEAVERKFERLLRERETMGPVNLRAEREASELSEQIETLSSERTDLEAAIGKLRQAIVELNRQGRKRLLVSFAEVDRHFQELFIRLFGGGQAHLQLVESDDPLDAGLEIMASPPGKRLQVLSLLSGGEQALTALALLFGVFLTNPAPICVLDEVDAPLDDANVDRFCTMLDEIAHSGKTRFLIITHHRMTMARMDRLFGVTMSERGVSQVVSVDLQAAEKLRDTG
ncbi:MAG: chromosome segregation protein SMC [Rhodospirillales bacterium]